MILSGDPDFLPLVSKPRENDKIVIGVGVKNSMSDLLIANCDEFICYDALVCRQPPRKKEVEARGILELEPEGESGGCIIKSCHVP